LRNGFFVDKQGLTSYNWGLFEVPTVGWDFKGDSGASVFVGVGFIQPAFRVTEGSQMRPMRRALFMPILLLLLSGGCSPLPPGIGSDHEVMVLANPEDWEMVYPLLQEIFERKVRTPQEENVFTVRKIAQAKFDLYKKSRNLLLISPLNSVGPAAQEINSLLSPQARQMVEEGRAFLFAKRDVWAKDQELVILTAPTYLALREKLAEGKEDVFRVMEKALNEKTMVWLFKKGEQKKLEKELFQKWGWHLRIPWGFSLRSEAPGFVWLLKKVPDRWISIWWEESEDSILTPQWVIKKKNEIGRTYYQGEEVVSSYLGWRRVSLNGHRGWKVWGTWQNPQLVAGGPFRLYCFWDRESKRRYIVDGALFAPGIKKEPYLRQLDLIMQTFTTKYQSP